MLGFMLIRYSTDLRKSVLDFVNKGGSKAEAERTFGVSRQAIYNWLEAKTHLHIRNRGPKVPATLIMMLLRNMSLIFLIRPS